MVNPLYHSVELTRGAVFGALGGGPALLHLGVPLVCVVLMWFLACARMRSRVVGCPPHTHGRRGGHRPPRRPRTREPCGYSPPLGDQRSSTLLR